MLLSVKFIGVILLGVSLCVKSDFHDILACTNSDFATLLSKYTSMLMDLRGILKLGLLHMQMIGVWCVNEWSNLYAGQNIQVVELGPGRGTLSDDMLRVGLVICLYLGMVNWTVASSTLYYMYIFFVCLKLGTFMLPLLCMLTQTHTQHLNMQKRWLKVIPYCVSVFYFSNRYFCHRSSTVLLLLFPKLHSCDGSKAYRMCLLCRCFLSLQTFVIMFLFIWWR